jgi:hypothetical protein
MRRVLSSMLVAGLVFSTTSLFAGQKIVSKVKWAPDGKLVVQNLKDERVKVAAGQGFIRLTWESGLSVDLPLELISDDFIDVTIQEEGDS